MKFMRSMIGGTAAALLLMCGCFAPPSLEEKLDASLDRQASTLIRLNGTAALRQWQKYCEDAGAQILQMPADAEQKGALMRMLSAADLGLRLLGAEDVLLFGASSAPLPQEPGIFRNRAALLHGPASAKGAFWSFSGADRDLAGEIGAVPGNALLAADFAWDPAPVCRVALRLLGLLSGRPGDPVKDGGILDGLQGEYGFLILPLPPRPDGGTLGIMAVMPDRNGRIFDLLSKYFGSPREDLVVLPLADKGDAPYLRRDRENGTLTFFNSVRCEAALGNAETVLLPELPEFQRISSGIRPHGSGFFYCSSKLGAALYRQFPGMLPVELPETFGVIRKSEDGLRMEMNSRWDWNTIAAAAAISCAVRNGAEEWLKHCIVLQRTVHLAMEHDGCVRNLKALGGALKEYAKTHNGAYPAASELPGSLELASVPGVQTAWFLCPAATGDTAAAGKLDYDHLSYVYFGGGSEKSPAKRPLFMDFPANHGTTFAVLFADGTVERFSFDGTANCRRAVSILQAHYRYSEKDFMTLLRVAEDLDRRFGSK